VYCVEGSESAHGQVFRLSDVIHPHPASETRGLDGERLYADERGSTGS
jgi:hypothetical protein